MAGKHTSVEALKPEDPPVYPGSNTDRAYDEGRRDFFKQGEGINPHPANTPEFTAFATGFGNGSIAKEQIQTCWAGGS